MATEFRDGRLLITDDSAGAGLYEGADEGDPRYGFTRLHQTRATFKQLTTQIKKDRVQSRLGEFREPTQSNFVQSNRAILDEDSKSESDLEPDEAITSLTVGMLPEFIFNVCMFLKFCTSFFMFGNGMTAMRWTASIFSFICPHDDMDAPTEVRDRFYSCGDPIVHGPYYHLNWVGLVIMTIAILDVVFVLLLWHSVFFYKKNRIIPHCVIILLLETPIFALAWAAYSSAVLCRPNQFNVKLLQYLIQYGSNHFYTRKINDLQYKMGCCGFFNWTDYERMMRNETQFLVDTLVKLTTPDKKPVVNFYQQLHKTIVPFTCCKWPWVANLYCAEKGTEWYHHILNNTYDKSMQDTVQERFYTQGCYEKVNHYCNNVIKRILSRDQEIIYAIYLVLNIIIYLMVYFIMQKINLMKLEAESLYDFQKLEIYDNTFESDDSAEFDNESDDDEDGGGDGTKSKRGSKKGSKSKLQVSKTPTLREIYEGMNKLEQEDTIFFNWETNEALAKAKAAESREKLKNKKERKLSSLIMTSKPVPPTPIPRPPPQDPNANVDHQNTKDKEVQTPKPYQVQLEQMRRNSDERSHDSAVSHKSFIKKTKKRVGPNLRVNPNLKPAIRRRIKPIIGSSFSSKKKPEQTPHQHQHQHPHHHLHKDEHT